MVRPSRRTAVTPPVAACAAWSACSGSGSKRAEALEQADGGGVRGAGAPGLLVRQGWYLSPGPILTESGQPRLRPPPLPRYAASGGPGRPIRSVAVPHAALPPE